MKLTELQYYRVTEASRHLFEVLSAIKRKKIKPKDMDAFKTLESSVQHLECFRLDVEVPLTNPR